MSLVAIQLPYHGRFHVVPLHGLDFTSVVRFANSHSPSSTPEPEVFERTDRSITVNVGSTAVRCVCDFNTMIVNIILIQ
jgi:hypothetical protein